MTLYSAAQSLDQPRVDDTRKGFRYRHDWTALGDRYIDRGYVRQRVAFACQRPRACRNLPDRPPFPWRSNLGGGNRPAELATWLRLPAAISAEHVEGPAAARKD